MIQRLFRKHKHLLRRTLSTPQAKASRDTHRAMVPRGEPKKVVMKTSLAPGCLVVKQKSTKVVKDLGLQFPIYKIWSYKEVRLPGTRFRFHQKTDMLTSTQSSSKKTLSPDVKIFAPSDISTANSKKNASMNSFPGLKPVAKTAL